MEYREGYAESWARRRPHLPLPLIDATASSISMDNFIEPSVWPVREEYLDMYAPGQRILAGFFLPPFQRPAVWDATRKAAFIESAHLGIHLGTIVWNDSSDTMEGQRFHRTDRWLIDGQQRLTAIMGYVSDEFPVFAGTPHEHRWSELNDIERRTFGHIQIGSSRLRSADEIMLRRAYDRLNFGGVAHAEDQRALPAGTA